MKSTLVLVISLFGTLAWAQVTPTTPVPSAPVATSLSFDAKSVATGGGTKTQNSGSVGLSFAGADSRQTHQSRIRLEVRFRNFGTAPAQARVDCYFVASDAHHGLRYIWDSVARDISVPAGGQLPEFVESSNLTQTTEQSFQTKIINDGIGNRVVTQQTSKTTSGAKPYGWIVRLVAGERVLKVQASSNDLETIGRDPKMIETLERQKPVPPPPPVNGLPRVMPRN